MKIEIRLADMQRQIDLKIDYDKKVALLNGKAININFDHFVSRLLAIIQNWKSEIVSPRTLDSLSYSIHVERNDKIYNYSGANSFPDNFDSFTTLLKENKIW